MNQHQRKFLLEQIEKQYKIEWQELQQRKPDAPSLNNYLIAALLDGSAKMLPPETVRETFRQRVRDLGRTEALVVSGERWGRRDAIDCIEIPALLLFEEPPEYAVARRAYEEKLAAWEQEKKALEASINAMRIKVQVGTDRALASLADQADKLCSMSLTASSRLLLPGKVA